LAAVEMILLVRPVASGETRDRGVILARMGRKEEALMQLEAYLNAVPEAADSHRILGLVQELRDGGGRGS